MSKAALFAINTTQQTLTGGGSVDLGNPLHGFGNTNCGCSCGCGQKIVDVNGNNLVIRATKDGGMYGIVFNVAVTASAAGTVTLQAYQDGAVIGSAQPVNIAAANDAESVTVAIGPRVACGANSIITLVATTTAGNVIIGGVNTLAWKL